MAGQSCVYIKKAMFFETRTARHKPVAVAGRDFYSLTYRYSGEAHISSGDTELSSGADSITFMPKGVAYTTEIVEDVHMAVIHFDFENDGTLLSPAVINAENTVLRALFKALVKGSTDMSADLSGMSIFYEILAELAKLRASREMQRIPERIELARIAIEDEYADPFFSVTALAERVGVSTAYLRREFRAAYGETPIGCLKRLRIERARLLLLTDHGSVARIAEQCGYTCPSYFIQDFHRATGESPGSYRERLLDSP